MKWQNQMKKRRTWALETILYLLQQCHSTSFHHCSAAMSTLHALNLIFFISKNTCNVYSLKVYNDYRESAFTPLIDDLKNIWEGFLTTAASGLKDYLSVEQLGLVLRRLAEKSNDLNVFYCHLDKRI